MNNVENKNCSYKTQWDEIGTQPFKRKLEYLQQFALNICIFNEFFHSDVIDLWIPIKSLAFKSSDSIRALSCVIKASQIRGCFRSDVNG